MNQRRGLNSFVGTITVGLSAIGILGVLAALVAFLGGDTAGAGLCLIASALALGLLINALLRS